MRIESGTPMLSNGRRIGWQVGRRSPARAVRRSDFEVVQAIEEIDDDDGPAQKTVEQKTDQRS